MNGADAASCGVGASPVPLNRYLIFFSIALVGCAVDLLSKQWIFEWSRHRGTDPTWWLWEGYVGVQTTVNQGALFGYGQGYSTYFAALSIVAAIGILVWLFYHRAARDLLLTIALASVTGGILGNLYDRLGMWHGDDVPAHLRNGVRDWILLRYQAYTWPNFNIADCLLVCGAALLLWHAFCQRDGNAAEAESNTASAS